MIGKIEHGERMPKVECENPERNVTHKNNGDLSHAELRKKLETIFPPITREAKESPLLKEPEDSNDGSTATGEVNSAENTSSSVDDANIKQKPNESEHKLDNTVERNLEEELREYFDDLHKKSVVPETLKDKLFDVSSMEKLTPAENSIAREEFDDLKTTLKRQWEVVNGKPWPKYEADVYSTNGKLIRKAGADYDAHHIQPLSVGGKNEVGNITPLHAEVHYDKQGIHAANSPYSRMTKLLGGEEQ